MRGLEMEFSPSAEMDRIQDLTDDFFEHVLYDEKPLFVSDEATIWDVSTSEAPDLIIRLAQHYQKPVTMDDLKQPLWKLLRQMNGLKS
jgi:hypothetical protein